MLFALNLLSSPRPALTTSSAAPEQWRFPAGLNARPVQLRPGELDWLLRDGAESVTWLRFEWRGIRGSMLLVPSKNWRAHHYPERCFENYGLLVERSATNLVNNSLPVRFLTLTNGKPGGQLTAAYWFQAADRATDDYGTRLWSALSLNPQRWVLVSILFDDGLVPDSPETQSLYMALRDTVHERLNQP
jgi:exosortase O